MRKRKRNYIDSFDSSEGGREDEERACRAAKVDSDVSQSKYDLSSVRLLLLHVTAPLQCWLSSIAHESPCYRMLTESKELTDPYIDLGYWTSTLPNEATPLDDFVGDTASLYVSVHCAPHRREPSNPLRGDVIR